MSLIMALVAAPALAAADPGLVGSWTLVSATATAADGSPQPLAFVDSPAPATGLLVYTADGIVTVQIVGAPRPTIMRSEAVADPASGAAALRHYYAYYGRYEVDIARHRIVHHVVASLWPGEAGASYARTYTLDSGRLTFVSDPTNVEGTMMTNRLTWVRTTP